MSTFLHENLISTKEASKLSGYNPDYLSRLCRSGRIESTQVGRTWLIERPSLETFIVAQEKRKAELSEELSRAREEEYRRVRELSAVSAIVEPIEKEVTEAVYSLVTTVASVRIPHSSAWLRGPAATVALTALVMAGSVLVAGSGVIEQAGTSAFAGALEVRSLILESGERALAYAEMMHEQVIDEALEELMVHDRAVASASQSNVVPFVDTVGTTLALASVTHSSSTRSGLSNQNTDASLLEKSHETFVTLAANPEGAAVFFIQEQTSLPENVFAESDTTFADSVIHAVTFFVETPRTIVSAYEEGIYAYVEYAPNVPGIVTNAVFTVGDTMTSAVAALVQRTPAVYEQSAYAYAAYAADTALDIEERSYAFGYGTKRTLAAVLTAQDRLIVQGVDASRTFVRNAAETASHAVVMVPSMAIGRVETQVRTVARLTGPELLSASVISVPDIENAVTGFFDRSRTYLAGILENAFYRTFGPLVVFVDVVREVEFEAVPAPESVAEDVLVNTESHLSTGPVTIVRNEYPSLVYTGASKEYVDAKLEQLRYAFGRSLDNATRRSSGDGRSSGISSIDGLTGANVVLNDSSFNGGMVNALSVEATAYIAGPYVLATSTTATSAFSGNIAVGRNATVGTTAADLLTVHSSIASSLIPATSNTYDIGSSDSMWRRGYFDEIIVSNFIVGSTSISGTASDTFTLNANNASNDLENISIVFERGLATPNAQLIWNASTKRFEFSMPVYAENMIMVNATTSNLFADSISLGNSAFSSFLGNGLANVGSFLTVDNTALAGSFFQQNGNSFAAGATLGTNDAQNLTLETNNTPRITVLAGGMVGIGTTTPTNYLSINSGTEAFPLHTVSSHIRAGAVFESSATTGPNNTVEFRLRGWDGSTMGTLAQLIARDANNTNSTGANSVTIRASQANGALAFDTGGNNERLRITAVGNVGIGTTNPVALLNIEGGSGSTALRLANTFSSTAVTGNVNLDFANTNATNTTQSRIASVRTNLINNGDADLAFSTLGSGTLAEKMRILSSGNVGIGTTTPASALTVVSGTNALGQLRIGTVGQAGSIALIRGDGNAVNFGSLGWAGASESAVLQLLNGSGIGEIRLNATGASGFVSTYVNGAERMRVTSTGNVGIGTTTPADLLTVNNGMIRVDRPVTGNSITMFRFYSSGVERSRIGLDINNQFSVLNTSGGALVSVTNSGNVGIATTSPADTLSVSGSAHITGGVGIGARALNASQPGLYVERTNDAGITSPLVIGNLGTSVGTEVSYDFRVSGTASGRISNIRRASSDRGLAFSTYGGSLTERMYLSGAGSLGIGTTTPSARLAVTGSGTGTGRVFTIADSSNVERLTVLDNGNVGIGTTSPSAALTLGVGQFSVPDGTLTAPSIALGPTLDKGIYSRLSSTINFVSAGVGRLEITTSNLIKIPATGVFGFTSATTNNVLDTGVSRYGANVIAIGNGTAGSTGGTLLANIIGVGTVSPETPLHVAGSSLFQGSIHAQSGYGAGSLVIGGNVNSFDRTADVRKVARIVAPTYDNVSANVMILSADNNGTNNRILFGGYPNSATITAATSIEFLTADSVNTTGGSTRMFINNVGNVGIGTSAPTQKLTVIGNVDADYFLASSTDSAALPGYTWTGDTNTGMFRSAADTLGLSTNGLQRLTVSSTGNVGIGTTTPTAELHTTGTVRFSNFAAGALTTDANGNVTASSDERLKNISGSFNRGLASIMEINPINFHWKNSTGFDTVNSYTGFSAQNVQRAIPEAIDTDNRGHLTLSDRPILAASVNAIKELNLRTLYLASGSVGAVERNLAVTSNADIAGELTVARTGTFKGYVEASAFLVGNTSILPEEVLTSGRADLYKMGTYALTNIEFLAGRMDIFIDRMDSLEKRLLVLESENSAVSKEAPFSLSSLRIALSSVEAFIDMGIARFSTLVFRQIVVSADEEGNSSAGSITILAGNTVAEIENPYVQANSKIFITFTSPVRGSWYISRKEEGMFQITLESRQDNDTSFDYFVMQSEGENTQIASPMRVIPTPQPVPIVPPTVTPKPEETPITEPEDETEPTLPPSTEPDEQVSVSQTPPPEPVPEPKTAPEPEGHSY